VRRNKFCDFVNNSTNDETLVLEKSPSQQFGDSDNMSCVGNPKQTTPVTLTTLASSLEPKVALLGVFSPKLVGGFTRNALATHFAWLM